MLGLILLVGINLRTVLLAVPPILPVLSHDLHLSYTERGLLTSIPTLTMAVASFPAGILIGKLGGRIIVAFGLALLAIGAFLRAFWPAILLLYIFTAVLSLGSTLSQTAIPTVVRQWFPKRIGFATALYTDGLVIGETLGAVLTLPLIGWLGHNAWVGSFVFWSIPVVMTLVLWLWLAPPLPVGQTAKLDDKQLSLASKPDLATRVRKPPHVSPWTLGLLTGGAQLIYFGMNAWISSYNQAIHAAGMTALTLGMLNAAQFPATLLATVFADQLVGRRASFIVAGALCVVAFAGWVWTPVFLQPLWAALLGGATILIFTLGLALPALLARGKEVAKWTGIMLTLGYTLSFLGPFIGGWLWDMTQVPAVAFLPMAFASVLILALSLLLPIQKHDTATNVITK